MTAARADEIVAGVSASHKEFKLRAVERWTHKIYRASFDVVYIRGQTINLNTLKAWFAVHKGGVIQVGYDVRANEMYCYFQEAQP